MEINLSEAKQYTGSYRGIRFMISNHGIGDSYRPDGTWCYYLYVNEKQLIDKYKKDFILNPVFDEKGRLSHKYYDAKITDFNWHGGITFYSKESGADGEPIIVKMGCDYAHLGDEGASYNELFILTDIKSSIDCLHELFPEIKIWSSLYGGFYKESDGEYSEHGTFTAYEEREKLDLRRK